MNPAVLQITQYAWMKPCTYGFGKTVFIEIILANIILARMTGLSLASHMTLSALSPITSLSPPARGSRGMSTFMTQVDALMTLIHESQSMSDVIFLIDEPVTGAAETSRPAVVFTIVEELIRLQVPFVVAGQDRRIQDQNPFPEIGSLHNDFEFRVHRGISKETDLSGRALELVGFPARLMSRYRHYLDQGQSGRAEEKSAIEKPSLREL